MISFREPWAKRTLLNILSDKDENNTILGGLNIILRFVGLKNSCVYMKSASLLDYGILTCVSCQDDSAWDMAELIRDESMIQRYQDELKLFGDLNRPSKFMTFLPSSLV